MIKVLIVEDSRVVSDYLEFILSSDPGIEVIGNVSNGKLALEFLEGKKPDVITMDIDMPIMDGLEATRIIMSKYPIPIIIVTGSRNANEVKTSMEALAAGALSVVHKPYGMGHSDENDDTHRLITMVKLMSEVKVVTRKLHNGTSAKPTTSTQAKTHLVKEIRSSRLVAIGVSSGGPQVLVKVLSKITGKFPCPIVVVQHISAGFLPGLVNWLAGLINIPVSIATNREMMLPGHIYFAPDHYQMGVRSDGRINLTDCDRSANICPSVTYLFKSVEENYGAKALAMILTGMGSDGAEELKKLRNAGAMTIAQDKASSIVYGMPGVAAKLEAADLILNPEEIAQLLFNIESSTQGVN